MARLALVFLSLLALSAAPLTEAKRSHRAAPTAAGAALASDALGMKLLQRTPPGNAAVSPWSVWTALSMVHPGASGQTRAQIERVLELRGVGNRPGVANRRLRAAIAGSASASGARLDVANALWTQAGFPIEPPFLNALARDFGAPAQQVDFRGDAEGARRQINDWVAEHTEGKIGDLFAPGVVNARTRLTLANALYFKASWLTEFAPGKTHDDVFHAPRGDVSVPTMHQQGTYRYARVRGADAVTLPYKGDRLAMVILLPARGRLPALQRKLTVDALRRTVRAMKPAALDLALPRFHVETHLSLADTLSRLGMPRAFSDLAEFPCVSPEALKINAVEHKVWIDVGEKGTEAAAATGITFGPTSAPVGGRRLDVDRPFLFLVVDRKTNAALFLGRVQNPAQTGG